MEDLLMGLFWGGLIALPLIVGMKLLQRRDRRLAVQAELRQIEQDRRDREYDAQRAAFKSKWQTPRSTAPTAKAAAAQSKRDESTKGAK